MTTQDIPYLEGKRVLVIEDREENRRLMRAILRVEGATMLEAEGGLEGVIIAAREQPDVVLMDFQMPGLDGPSTTRIMRENPLTRALPIIFVTASATGETRRIALESGGDGILTKPLDPMRLSAQIAEILCNRVS